MKKFPAKDKPPRIFSQVTGFVAVKPVPRTSVKATGKRAPKSHRG